MLPSKFSEETKPKINIRICNENDDTIELLDDIDLPDDFKLDIVYPYLKHVYNDLSSRTSLPEQGIPKAIFIDVKSFNYL